MSNGLLMAAAKKRAQSGGGEIDSYWSYVDYVCNFCNGSITEAKNGYETRVRGDDSGIVTTELGTHLRIGDYQDSFEFANGSNNGTATPIYGLTNFVHETFISLDDTWYSAANHYPYLVCLAQASGQNAFLIYLEPGFPVESRIRAYGAAEGTSFTSDASNLINNVAYHFALVRSGSTLALFVNGTRRGVRTWDGDVAGSFHSLGGVIEADGYGSPRPPIKRYFATRCTIGTDRSYGTGATLGVEIPTYPFPTSGA